jgi:hypothetical protein
MVLRIDNVPMSSEKKAVGRLTLAVAIAIVAMISLTTILALDESRSLNQVRTSNTASSSSSSSLVTSSTNASSQLSSSLVNPYPSCPINVTFFGETVPAVPAGPTTKITLENVVNSSIIGVNATLDLWNSFVKNQSGLLPHYHTYVFATVNGTNPLYPEQSISKTDVIINAVIAEGLTYQLTIQGELQNDSQFQCSTNVILGSSPD